MVKRGLIISIVLLLIIGVVRISSVSAANITIQSGNLGLGTDELNILNNTFTLYSNYSDRYATSFWNIINHSNQAGTMAINFDGYNSSRSTALSVGNSAFGNESDSQIFSI